MQLIKSVVIFFLDVVMFALFVMLFKFVFCWNFLSYFK